MYRTPRGTQDILPEEQPYWHHLVSKIHRICQLYGYQQIDTPLFEETSLFIRGVGEGTDIVEKEMYTFQDKGGGSLTLRPEFTTSVVRAYIQHGMYTLPQPVRVYSIGPIFRYERPQAGRFRQHHQFNVEAIGEQDPSLDAEIISIPWQLYEELGFKGLTVQLNSIGCPKCRPAHIAALVGYYQDYVEEICSDCRRRLRHNPLRLLDCKSEGCQPIIKGAPRSTDYLCTECSDHLASLQRHLTVLNLPYELNPTLVRGFDYYTKTVFEVWAEGIGAQNALCGGGRYDGLVEELGGRPTPAIGFASGMERIILSMKEERVGAPPWSGPRVFVAYLGEETKEEAMTLLKSLRGAGIGAVSLYNARSLRSQMRRANRLDVTFTAILGEREVREGQVTVRDMTSGMQFEVERGDLVEWLGERLRE